VCDRFAPSSCFDPTWARWPVPPTTTPGNYTNNGDGTVTDIVTSLMWQQSSSTMKLDWTAANNYCSSLSLRGYADWRLPSTIELLSIVDYAKIDPAPSINTSIFTNTQVSHYWSSTSFAGSSADAWAVYFGGGGTASAAKSNALYTRCVR
jgi:hypothetical protein